MAATTLSLVYRMHWTSRTRPGWPTLRSFHQPARDECVFCSTLRAHLCQSARLSSDFLWVRNRSLQYGRLKMIREPRRCDSGDTACVIAFAPGQRFVVRDQRHRAGLARAVAVLASRLQNGQDIFMERDSRKRSAGEWIKTPGLAKAD